MLKKGFSFFFRTVVQNGILWSIPILVVSVISRVKSLFAAVALKAPGIFLGGGVKIIGARSIKFGHGIYVGGSVWIEAVSKYHDFAYKPKIEIGNNVSFSEGVHISCIEKILIGHDVLFGSHVYVSDHGHGSYRGPNQSDPDISPSKRSLGGGGAVFIDDSVWIGDNVVILGPVTIGKGAIIGANSVVRHDIPAASIAVGAPAVVVKRYDSNSQEWLKV